MEAWMLASRLGIYKSGVCCYHSANYSRFFRKSMSSSENNKRKPQEEQAGALANKQQKREGRNERSWRKDTKALECNSGSYANEEQRKRFQIELPNLNTPEGEQQEPQKRIKRKVALLLGYLGTNYGGFQMNPEQKTLQAELELALFRGHFLDKRNFGYPFKYGWSTSGRTDKGVHACAQVCSAKLELLPDHQSMEDVLNELNRLLPTEIRVLDIVRTTRNFCAKINRDMVRYQYMIPSFVLADSKTVRDLFLAAGTLQNGRQPSDPLFEKEVAQVHSKLKQYRVTPETLQRLKNALKTYEGTHSFHNFTKKLKSNEARASRFIVSFETKEPFVNEDNGMEWIPTQVLGQSFLLHQIRKMVCMAIDVTRGIAPMETITNAFDRNNQMRVGLAPAQGLFMDMAYYDRYNRKKQQQQSQSEIEDINWTDETKPAYGRWKHFRDQVVVPHIIEEEAREANFMKFLYIQEFLHDQETYYLLKESEDEEDGDAE